MASMLQHKRSVQKALSGARAFPRVTCGVCVAVLLGASCMVSAQTAEESGMKVRIKDVARFKGVEQHMLTGYGLVVGLDGTGDSDEPLTQQTISNVLHNYGMSIERDDLIAQNTAAVMVTATVRGSANKGDNIPATVSAVGDASSLTGGTLLLTPLKGPDGEVWAQGQGNLTIGGYSFGGGGGEGGAETVTRNHPLVGTLTNGAKLLRDLEADVQKKGEVVICLDDPDYTSAVNMAQAINEEFPGVARAKDAATVSVQIPRQYIEERRENVYMGKLEQISFRTDEPAKVVLNERTGTVVFGGDVKISKVALTHGNITVRVKTTPQVSQPPPLGSGETRVVEQQETDVQTEQQRIQLMPEIATVEKLVTVLNTLGATPRDIMVIMHSLRDSGALHAKLRSK